MPPLPLSFQPQSRSSTLTVTPLLHLPSTCLFLHPQASAQVAGGEGGGEADSSLGLSVSEQPWRASESLQEQPAEDRAQPRPRAAWPDPPVLPPQNSPSSTRTPPVRLAWLSSTSRTPCRRTTAPTPAWLRTPWGRCPAVPGSLSMVGASANTPVLGKGHRT